MLKAFHPGACGNCGATAEFISKNGVRSGRQRYRCRQCGASFTDTTGTAVHRLRAENVDVFHEAALLMYSYGLDPTEVAEHSGVALSTIYSWRQRIEADTALMQELTVERRQAGMLPTALSKARDLGLISPEELKTLLRSPDELSRAAPQVLRWLLPRIDEAERLVKEIAEKEAQADESA